MKQSKSESKDMFWSFGCKGEVGIIIFVSPTGLDMRDAGLTEDKSYEYAAHTLALTPVAVLEP